MNKTALITGASEGIGFAFAQLLAQKGYNLVLIARRSTRLEEIKKTFESTYSVKIHLLCLDLSLNDSPKLVYKFLEQEHLDIDLLVNNAGRGLAGPFKDTDWTNELQMIHLNAVNLVHLTKLLIPQMIQRKNGGIINVASTVGFVPGPFMSVYAATKAFILSFSQALAYELKSFGITVTALCPGPTRTEFYKTANIKNQKSFEQTAASAQEVAEFGYKSLLKRKSVAICGLINTSLVTVSRILPRNFTVSTTGRYQKLKY